MSVIAYDDANDPIYNSPDNWNNGDNGGSGFGAWVIPASTFSGGLYDLGDSNDNGSPAISPGINTANTLAWVMNASGGTACAERALPRAVQANDWICVELDPSDDSGQDFRLHAGDYAVASFSVKVTPSVTTPSVTNWILDDATGILDTDFAVNSGGFLLEFFFPTASSYIITIVRYSDMQSYVSAARNLVSTPDFFSIQNSQTTSPTDSFYINRITHADSSGGYSGCAGDPHFVGFDGKRFDFHDHGKFLLWKGAGMAVECVFSMEDRGKDWPDWKDKTFISELTVCCNGKREVFSAYDNFEMLPENLTMDGKRGLVQDLEFVPGILLGGRVIDFSAGKLIITQFEEPGFGVRHLNASFILDKPFVKAQGIIGQTIYPAYMWKPNESFKIS